MYSLIPRDNENIRSLSLENTPILDLLDLRELCEKMHANIRASENKKIMSTAKILGCWPWGEVTEKLCGNDVRTAVTTLLAVVFFLRHPCVTAAMKPRELVVLHRKTMNDFDSSWPGLRKLLLSTKRIHPTKLGYLAIHKQ